MSDIPPARNGPYGFVLDRIADRTGVSGTGVVAEGVMFSNGIVSVQWISEFPTSVVFHQRGMESVLAVHGHNGETLVRWVSEAPPLETLPHDLWDHPSMTHSDAVYR